MRELTIHDYRTMLAESEIRESQTKASITDYMNICEDLSRKLEEARGRIAELNSVIEQKNWQIDNLVEFENVNGEKQSAAELLAAKDARIAEQRAAIKPFVQWLEQMEQHPHVVSSKCTFEDDDLPFTVSVTWADLRNARSKLEGKSATEAPHTAETSEAITTS